MITYSVIVLAYQVQAELEACVHSVLCQRVPQFELILVDDGSTDGTGELCDRLARTDFRIRVLHQPNSGQLLARIRGFSAARGEYLLCLDGDDEWEPELLQTVHAYLERRPCDLAIFGHRRIQGDRMVSCVAHVFDDGTVLEGPDRQQVYELLAKGGPINEMWCKVIRRDLFARIRTDLMPYADIRVAEDWLYSLELVAEAQSILYIDRMLYRYRLRAGSIMHTFRPEELSDQIRVRRRVREWIREQALPEPSVREFEYNTCKYFADFIFRCALSKTPYAQKRALYQAVRQEPLFEQTRHSRKQLGLSVRHRLFQWLFDRSFLCLELYARLYRRLRRRG